MNLIRAILHPLTITLSLAISTLTAQTVTTSKGLSAAIAAANTSATATTINLAGGTYDLTTDLPGLAANSLTLQGPASGTPAIIDAAGLSSGIIFNVTADHIVIANLTLRNARNHAVAIQPGADSGRIENCAIGNPTAPLPATAAIDGNGCLNWNVTGNRISNIVGSSSAAEPAIHFYGGASGTTVTDNFVLNCDRAIGLGGDSVPFVPPTPVAPAIATQPASVTVNAGQTATFTVVATGTPSPSYQWRKNCTAISGATSAFYTTPVTIPADTGASFSVVLTNSAATITSNAAILTVNTTSTAPFPIGVWLQHALGNMRNNGQYDSVNYKSAGVNTYVGIWKFPYSGWADAEDSAAALTQLKELGIKVYAGSDQSAVDWLAAHPEYANTVVGYLLGDEPEMNKVNVTDPSQHLLDPSMPDGWKAAGDAIRSADGNRGRYANFGKGFALDPWVGYSILPGPTQADDFAKYVEPLTVLSSDFYGITDPWESANNHGIWTYGRAVSNTLKYAGTRPVWGFVEASAPFNETENGGQGSQRAIAFRMPPNYIMPIVWNMVVHGARGIIYFCHDFSTTGNTGGALGEPGMYDAMKAANESVQQYAAVLATDTVSGTSATTDGAVGVTTLTKKYSGATYVFAMAEGDSGHIQGQSVNSTIALAGGGSGTVEVIGENRSIAITNGTMATEHFDAYGIHIYRILNSGTSIAPAIATPPASVTAIAGQTATFTVVATGTPSPTYQWRKNGTAISGATSATYTTPATTTADNAALFTVVATNSAGSVTSNAALLTVKAASAAITIATQPANVAVTTGQTATFTVVATGNGPLSYQWSKNGTPISGARFTRYTTSVTSLTDSGTLLGVLVTDAAGNSIASANASLTVSDGPRRTQHYVDPVNGTASGDGSSTKPWKSLQDVIDNRVETQTWAGPLPYTSGMKLVAMNPGATVQAGDTIWLRSGDYGALTLASAYNSAPITVAAEGTSTPRFSNVLVQSSQNWILRGLSVSPSYATTYSNNTIVTVENHSWRGPAYDIEIDGFQIFSIPDESVWTLASDWDTKAANGIYASADRVVVRNCQIRNVNFALAMNGKGSRVERNTINAFCGDGMRGLGDDEVFEYNLVKNLRVVNDNHADGFQSWSLGADGSVGTGVVKNVTLRGNTFIAYENPNTPFAGGFQGIGCFDGAYENWIIENNVILSDTYHGIALYGAINCRIVNNTVLDLDTSNTVTPWILITDLKSGTPSQDCVVRNNLTASLNVSSDTTNNIVVDRNIVVPKNPAAYFVNLAQFNVRLAAGSPAIDQGSASQAPAIDADGKPRPQGTAFDVGAYEYAP
jgi:parallel beta-helix repeat protein